ncbi:MAG: low molecular weight protein-tyrosine-phosphatase [Chitinophagaceae bacterium]
MKILMVCLGNICRSPLAEGILKDKAKNAGLDWQVESAGTNGYHVGEAPHRLSQKVAQQRGINISGQCARTFVTTDLENFDIIYAMAEEVVDEMKWIAKTKFNAAKVKLLMNEVYPGKNMDVPDPWYGPEPGYHDVYDMIEAACDKIIENARALKGKENTI